MDMTGEQRIPADRATVWEALNDAEILKACIPGCQELTKHSETEMTAVAVVKVGPIAARFQGQVTLSEMDPPNGYRITGEGQGGVAGHAKGGALIRLTEDGDGTILHYEVSAQVGGRLAQLGGRMIDATARTMSGLFFKKFAQEILLRQSTSADAATTHPGAQPAATSSVLSPSTHALAMQPATTSSGTSSWLWMITGLLLGALVTGMFGLPILGRIGAHAGDNDVLTLIAVALALLQGYLLGRDGQRFLSS